MSIIRVTEPLDVCITHYIDTNRTNITVIFVNFVMD